MKFPKCDTTTGLIIVLILILIVLGLHNIKENFSPFEAGSDYPTNNINCPCIRVGNKNCPCLKGDCPFMKQNY